MKGSRIARRGALTALAVLGLAVASLQSARSQEVVTSNNNSAWAATWANAPMAPGSAFAAPTIFENQTIRQIAHIGVGGRRVRVRISNAFGAAPLLVGAAHIAKYESGASIVPGTDRTLKFSGQASISIPVGALALSDPVDLDVPSLSELAVSIFVPNNTGAATYHESSNQTTYISPPGNFTSATNLPTQQTATSWFFLSGIEVLPRARAGVIAVTGDSIAEGARSTLDANRRWTDVLSARLNGPFGRSGFGMLNQAIGCSRLLRDFCGQSGSARFDRDELAQTGITHVIIALGLVDIVFASVANDPTQAVTSDEVIVGLRQLIERAHARGLKAYGATLTPNEGSTFVGFFTPENEVKRQAVNRWIRTSGAFDGVIDFDRVVRDPAHPTRLLPIYASDDFTHPSDAGYEAMGNSIDLALFP
jgi:lysophospholipase L1-like esterase